jgi:tRNA-dihydrouridine synthase B
MRIGPFALPNNLLLAPMAGVTDLPFRRICRRLGAGLAVSEMVSANAALHTTPKTLRRLDLADEPHPRSVQILGADPRAMAEAARRNLDLGADIIDINMGCPARKVCHVAAGSALLRDEARVAAILQAVVAAVAAPVTLKIRTGWDAQSRNGVRIAQLAEASGIQALTVHGRTRACGFSGEAEYATIAEIKQRVAIPVIANGDIDSPEKARLVLQQTGADGLMIGRAACGRPWIFQQIGAYLASGRRPPPLPAAERLQIMREHLQGLYAFYGEGHGLRVARKHIAWYAKGLAGGAEFRQRINVLDSAAAQLAAVEAFFTRSVRQEEPTI